MIQQSPTEERASLAARLTDARDVFDSLSIYVSEGSLAALEIEQSQASIDAALSYLTSQAAQPAEADGVERVCADDGLPQRMLTSLLSGKCGVPRGHEEHNDECICGDREASEALIVLGLAYTSNRWPMAGVFLTGIGESLKGRMADPAFVKSLTASREIRL